MSANKTLKDYIEVIPNVISHDLCDQIIQEYRNDDEYRPARIGDETLDVGFRKLKTVFISDESTISVNQDERHRLDCEVFNAAHKAAKSYAQKHDLFVPSSDTGYQLLRYCVGDFYKQHTDSYEKNPRAVSCSFALNDDFEGGEFGFFDKEVILKAPKGAAVMFPSNFMYPHEIMPVISGTRYSIITWFI